MRSILTLLLLVGCAPLENLENDRLAADALRVEWYTHGRGWPVCEFTDNYFPVHEFSTIEALRAWCRHDGQPIGACLRDGTDIGILAHYDSPDPERTRAWNIIHEHIHALRQCWVREDPTRLHEGETEDWCPVNSSTDHLHCDFYAWENIGLSALELWGEWRIF